MRGVPYLLKRDDFLNRQNFFTAFLAFAVGIMLLFESAELGEGIKKGLDICSYSVIPSLFPFMALSVFICKSRAADFFAAALRPVTKLLKIPAVCGGALLASFIGGYPAGAKCIGDLVCEGVIGRKTAARMLCFCVNAGPPFLISTVGFAVFGSIETGFLLFCAQFISSLVIALCLSFFSEYPTEQMENIPLTTRKNSAACITESVISAAESCFRMCAFIVIACGALELIYDGAAFSSVSGNPLAKALFTGFFEVTAGVLSCSEIEGFPGVIAAGAIASFSGVSVMLQVAAVTDESKTPLAPFIVSRFFHSVITAGILRLFLMFSGGSTAAFSVRGGSYDAVLSASAPAAVSLLCMASLFLLSLVPPKSEKEPLLSRIWHKITAFGHSQTK